TAPPGWPSWPGSTPRSTGPTPTRPRGRWPTTGSGSSSPPATRRWPCPPGGDPRAFLVREPTMAQRLVRAKRKIAEAHIPYRVPPDEALAKRLSGVLAVVYLVFNEGYGATQGDRLVRGELCSEAIRLARLLAELMPGRPEVLGLLALMLLHDARRGAPGGEHRAVVPPPPPAPT